MNVRYKKEAKAAYMILEGSEECEEYAARMLQENRIRGVMPLTIREIDGQREYCFDISCGRTLSGVLERRQVTLSEIRALLEALAHTEEQMDEYLMNVNHLLLDPGMICLTVQSRRSERGYERLEADFSRPVFCCHPAEEKDFLGQVRELIRFFLNRLDHMEEQSVEKAYELFQISQKEYFRLEEMLEVFAGDDREEPSCRDMEEPEEDLRSPVDVSGPAFGPGLPELPERRGRRSGRGKSRAGVLLGPALMLLGAVLCFWNLLSLFLPGISIYGLGEQSLWAGLACLAAGAMITMLGAAEGMSGTAGRSEGSGSAGSRRVVRELPGTVDSLEELPGKGSAVRALSGNAAGIRDLSGDAAGIRELTGALPVGGDACEGGTQLLTGSFPHEAGPMLQSRDQPELDNIFIRKLPFLLGKKGAVVDGAVDWPTISRHHAEIRYREGRYYLEDCSSTNGTFVNGSRILPGLPIPLEVGDEVALADRRFIFRFG